VFEANVQRSTPNVQLSPFRFAKCAAGVFNAHNAQEVGGYENQLSGSQLLDCGEALTPLSDKYVYSCKNRS
jgi:hypothetical protein